MIFDNETSESTSILAGLQDALLQQERETIDHVSLGGFNLLNFDYFDERL